MTVEVQSLHETEICNYPDRLICSRGNKLMQFEFSMWNPKYRKLLEYDAVIFNIMAYNFHPFTPKLKHLSKTQIIRKYFSKMILLFP